LDLPKPSGSVAMVKVVAYPNQKDLECHFFKNFYKWFYFPSDCAMAVYIYYQSMALNPWFNILHHVDGWMADIFDSTH
jgi:hypothetical protein